MTRLHHPITGGAGMEFQIIMLHNSYAAYVYIYKKSFQGYACIYRKRKLKQIEHRLPIQEVKSSILDRVKPMIYKTDTYRYLT